MKGRELFLTVAFNNIFESGKALLRAGAEGFHHLLWPAVCDNCGAKVAESEGLCGECWRELLRCSGGDYCRRCGKDVSRYAMIDGGCGHCQGLEICYDGIARAGVYDGTMRDMILAFKFHDKTELGGQLGRMAVSALEGSVFRESIDVVTPVPLHWKRKLGRGFNQSAIIAKGLKSERVRFIKDLVRVRNTQRQWALSPAKRKKNVAGAFAVRKDHRFAGKSVCLVDDITTSGATLNECAKTLKEAGAEKVFAVVVAVAMQDTE